MLLKNMHLAFFFCIAASCIGFVSSAEARQHQCHGLFTKFSDPAENFAAVGSMSIIVKTSEEDLKNLAPEYREVVAEISAMAQRTQEDPTITLSDVFPSFLKMLSLMPVENRDSLIRDLLLLGKMKQKGDMTLFNEISDRYVLQKNFDEWLKMVYHFQKANLSKNDDSVAILHPSWLVFREKMGLISQAEIQHLFGQELAWINAKSLRKHYKQRTERKELELNSQDELVRVANAFLRSERESQIIFRRNEDILVKYDTKTQEIAIISSDAKIITYFIVIDAYRQSQSRNYFLGHFLLGLSYPKASDID